jgi:nucleotide-binding universal stress UspA family protein
MSSASLNAPARSPSLEAVRAPSGPILIATDAGPESDTAFPLAMALAAQSGAELQVVSIVEPITLPMYGIDGMVMLADSTEEVRALRQTSVRAQIGRLLPNATPSVTIRTGEPATEIATYAAATNARALVVGRGRHSRVDRWFGGEIVMRLLQLGDTPVLAAEAGLVAPPARVLIATDFSEHSVYAARVALPLIAPDAKVFLVHVGPPYDESVPFLRDSAIAYREGVTKSFASLRASLPEGKWDVETVLLTGTAPDQLMTFITGEKVDLVVSATHGYGFIRRFILGSVAATLVRHAPCSVLCVPGSARAMAASRARTQPNATTRTLDASTLDTELSEFSRRNAGRSCRIEVDDTQLGAQVLAHDLALVGATSDRRSRSLSLIFGASVLAGRHLTHTISDPGSVDLASDGSGADQVLRIAHAGGQTLVSLH